MLPLATEDSSQNCPTDDVKWRGDWPALSSNSVQEERWGVLASIELTGWKATEFLAPRVGAGDALADTLKSFLMMDESVANMWVHHAYAREFEVVAQVITIMGTNIAAINASSAFVHISMCGPLRAELLRHANTSFTARNLKVPISIDVDLATVEVRNFTPLDKNGIIVLAVLSGLFGMLSVIYLRLWKGGRNRVLCPVEETNWEQIVIRKEDVL